MSDFSLLINDVSNMVHYKPDIQDEGCPLCMRYPCECPKTEVLEAIAKYRNAYEMNDRLAMYQAQQRLNELSQAEADKRFAEQQLRLKHDIEQSRQAIELERKRNFYDQVSKVVTEQGLRAAKKAAFKKGDKKTYNEAKDQLEKMEWEAIAERFQKKTEAPKQITPEPTKSLEEHWVETFPDDPVTKMPESSPRRIHLKPPAFSTQLETWIHKILTRWFPPKTRWTRDGRLLINYVP